MSSSSGGATDPRVLIPKIQLLSEQTEDWEQRAGSSLEQAEYAQRHATEQVNRMIPHLSSAHNRHEEDRASVDSLWREVERCRERCAEIKSRAIAAHQAAANADGAANRALSNWQGELSSAKNWLSTARSREAEAERRRNSAASALQNAEYELSRAESALQGARYQTVYAGRDREGRDVYRPIDTTPYQRAVNAASQQVSDRRHDLALANVRLQDAVADRHAAERRVAACERAVGLCKEAEDHGKIAFNAAACSSSAAERAFEEQQRGTTCHALAAEKLAEQKSEFARAQANFADAQNGEQGAHNAVKYAGEKLAEARLRSTQGRLEMEWRVGKLREFDAPMFGF